MTYYKFRTLSGQEHTLQLDPDKCHCYRAIDQLLLKFNNSECKGNGRCHTENTILNISIVHNEYILDIYDLLNIFEDKEFTIIINNNNFDNINKMIICKCTRCYIIQSYNSFYMGNICLRCDLGLVIPELLQITKYSDISCDIPFEYLGEINIIEWNLFRDTMIEWQRQAIESEIGYGEYLDLKEKQKYTELSDLDEKILLLNQLF